MYRIKILIFLWMIFISGCRKNESAVALTVQSDTTAHDRIIGGLMVKGKVIDNQTRCSHYHTDLDIIAIKFKCCDTYYPCYSCHKESADHKAITWPENEWDHKAILCGVCGHELTVKEYMASNNTCPLCQSSFNPNCKKHYDLYFSMN
ncbi:MAG TPA: CHY zinc finger protein [Cyclobacteriaceae bacterium]|nr:CHY zinc finger protein [Cyclobacteriaceae bacterium]HPW63903.1 CHY zinc finger protein [Cyclobacteriaceae bacterium]